MARLPERRKGRSSSAKEPGPLRTPPATSSYSPSVPLMAARRPPHTNPFSEPSSSRRPLVRLVPATMPPQRVFGSGSDSALDVDPNPRTPQREDSRNLSGRMSFSSLVRNPSVFSRWSRAGGDEESGPAQAPDKPPIPSALQQSEAYSTPLPKLSMIVLSIVRLTLRPEKSCRVTNLDVRRLS